MKITSTIFYLFNTHSHICCQFIIFIIKNKRGMCYCIFSKCTYFFICKSSWNPKCIRRSINKRFLFRSQHYSRFSYILKIVKLFFRKKLFITSNGIRLLPPTMDISSIKNLPVRLPLRTAVCPKYLSVYPHPDILRSVLSLSGSGGKRSVLLHKGLSGHSRSHVLPKSLRLILSLQTWKFLLLCGSSQHLFPA